VDICHLTSYPLRVHVAVTPRPLARTALAAIVVGLIVIVGLAPPKASASTAHIFCGVERWNVKTLQDRPTLLPVQTTTIASLIAHPKPSPLPGTRAPFERHQFKVTAQVVRMHSEHDGDVHLVLKDAAGHTMIAEAPNASCEPGATAYRRHQMAQARAAVKICGQAEIMGVAFFDFFHNQDGVAPNAIELHPILSFRCLASAAAPTGASKAKQPGTSSHPCDPSYKGACLNPAASDYDCAGGSGDGPYYTGPVRVVGPDHFGLDRDGDGYACENS
jgi:hypothetical protein